MVANDDEQNKPFPGWALVLIIIAVIIVFAVGGFLLFYYFDPANRKLRAKLK